MSLWSNRTLRKVIPSNPKKMGQTGCHRVRESDPSAVCVICIPQMVKVDTRDTLRRQSRFRPPDIISRWKNLYLISPCAKFGRPKKECAMAMGTRSEEPVPGELFITSGELPRSMGHPFYAKLNQLLGEAGFDRFVESACASFYDTGAAGGRPSIPPGAAVPGGRTRGARRGRQTSGRTGSSSKRERWSGVDRRSRPGRGDRHRQRERRLPYEVPRRDTHSVSPA
jgi:hypothetical protein